MAGNVWVESPNGAESVEASTKLADLLGRWYEASHDALGWSFDAWYGPGVAAAAAVIDRGVVDRDARATLSALGSHRAVRGRSQEEALADLECAIAVGPLARSKPRSAAARRAFVDGFLNPASDPSWFGDARALSRSLRPLYGETEGRKAKAAAHALLLVDVNLSWLAGPERALALAGAAEALHAQFPYADLVACLGEPRFAIVVHRHPGVAAGAEALEHAFEGNRLLAGATTTLLLPLPEQTHQVGPFVRELAGADRPVRVRAYEPRTAAAGGPGAELLRSAVPVSSVRPPRRLASRVPSMLADASGLVAAAIAALVLAAGIGKAVGPVSVAQSPTTQLFGLAPPSVAPQVGADPFLALNPASPAIAEEVAVPEPAIAVAAPTPVVAVREAQPASAPVAATPPVTAPPAPPAPPASAPPATTPTTPPTTVAPAPASEPAVASQTTSDADGPACAGLEDKDERRCRIDQRRAEKQTERQSEQAEKQAEKDDD